MLFSQNVNKYICGFVLLAVEEIILLVQMSRQRVVNRWPRDGGRGVSLLLHFGSVGFSSWIACRLLLLPIESSHGFDKIKMMESWCSTSFGARVKVKGIGAIIFLIGVKDLISSLGYLAEYRLIVYSLSFSHFGLALVV